MKRLMMIGLVVLLAACQQEPKEPECDQFCWQQKADAEWKKEHGEFQTPLSPEHEQEIYEYLKKHYPDTDFDNHTLGEQQ
ncbi:hypothetical protein NYR30_00245 [Gallibacterium salpingitidis]|uniref:hypothetical protein n=1 Tax=Gallibacterium salpingitidis TaxID=505341 RepID=UPI00266EF074|nr:hypothetical protein [Gallibacterium salpingitidis]WKS99763.1 hypothetical protein NYR30_00245 [Gallibacterium salpingitidis]